MKDWKIIDWLATKPRWFYTSFILMCSAICCTTAAGGFALLGADFLRMLVIIGLPGIGMPAALGAFYIATEGWE